MIRYLVLCVTLLTTAWGDGAAGAQEPTRRVLGLVEVPSVVPKWFFEPGETPVEPAPVTLRSRPSTGGEVLAVVDDPEQIETREHGYEESSAVVYGYERAQDRTWYGIRLASGELGWLEEREAGRFRPISELLVNSLAYTTDSWDGQLYRAAGRPETALTVPGAGTDRAIEIASSTRVGTDIYFLVVVLDQSICASGEPGEVVAAGWIPAHAASGETNLWYYSRGC